MKINKIYKEIYQFIFKKVYQYKIFRNKSLHRNFHNKKIEVSIVMTCFNQIDYTINGMESLLSNTKDKNNIKYKYYLLDDCSTDNTYEKFHSRKDLIYYCGKKQKGVNNLWNVAFELTKKSDYVIITNNDVKFSENWSEKLINEMIKRKSVAAGPITNAPGNRKKQDVRFYLNNYSTSDKDNDINLTSNKLEKINAFHYRALNGFCMAFNVRWLDTLDKPIINSPDPNFAGEDLLFKKYPCNPLIVPSSFIFHYKQVTVSRDNFKKQHYRKIC